MGGGGRESGALAQWGRGTARDRIVGECVGVCECVSYGRVGARPAEAHCRGVGGPVGVLVKCLFAFSRRDVLFVMP